MTRPPALARPALTPQPLPRHGTQRRYWPEAHDNLLAPLKIVTAAGSPHHLIKVVDWDDGTTILTVFVHGGQTVEVELPLGGYRFRYATGRQWYGDRALFGSETAYYEADKRLMFELDGTRVVGYAVELIKQRHGNLKTRPISPAEF